MCTVLNACRPSSEIGVSCRWFSFRRYQGNLSRRRTWSRWCRKASRNTWCVLKADAGWDGAVPAAADQHRLYLPSSATCQHQEERHVTICMTFPQANLAANGTRQAPAAAKKAKAAAKAKAKRRAQARARVNTSKGSARRLPAGGKAPAAAAMPTPKKLLLAMPTTLLAMHSIGEPVMTEVRPHDRLVASMHCCTLEGGPRSLTTFSMRAVQAAMNLQFAPFLQLIANRVIGMYFSACRACHPLHPSVSLGKLCSGTVTP